MMKKNNNKLGLPNKTFVNKFLDFLFSPLRLTIFSDEINERIGLTSLTMERIKAVLPELRGYVLDIGCGKNRLLQVYNNNGIGVDVYDYGGGALIVKDCSRLPFRNESFDTVTFLACLNHIPNREKVLEEAYRVLKRNGRIIATMINPILGYIGHKFFWWYDDDHQRILQKGELYGLWNREVIRLLLSSGFKKIRLKKFTYRLNNCFIGYK
jgi:SAM-dependent methyltransferase